MLIFCIALIFTVHLIKVAQCGGGENEERMPLAMDEDDYQALFDALLQGKVEVIKRNTTLRRAYTRLRSGKYTLKEDIHPVTGIMTKVL